MSVTKTFDPGGKEESSSSADVIATANFSLASSTSWVVVNALIGSKPLAVSVPDVATDMLEGSKTS